MITYEGLDRSSIEGHLRYMSANPAYFEYVAGVEYSARNLQSYMESMLPLLDTRTIDCGGKYHAPEHVVMEAQRKREERNRKNRRMMRRHEMQAKAIALRQALNTLWG